MYCNRSFKVHVCGRRVFITIHSIMVMNAHASGFLCQRKKSSTCPVHAVLPKMDTVLNRSRLSACSILGKIDTLLNSTKPDVPGE